jgi:hypothetical protein
MIVRPFRKRTVMPSFLSIANCGTAPVSNMRLNRNITAGAAWEFMDAGPGPFSNRRGPLAGTLQGHYSTNYLNFLAPNVIWRF